MPCANLPINCQSSFKSFLSSISCKLTSAASNLGSISSNSSNYKNAVLSIRPYIDDANLQGSVGRNLGVQGSFSANNNHVFTANENLNKVQPENQNANDATTSCSLQISQSDQINNNFISSSINNYTNNTNDSNTSTSKKEKQQISKQRSTTSIKSVKSVKPTSESQSSSTINFPKSTSSSLKITNKISTRKYSNFNFPFKFLREQFSALANLWFLFVSICQQIPDISPTGRWTTIGPMLIILFIAAIREIYEDFRRYKEDRKINNKLTLSWSWKSNSWVQKKWQELHSGNFVYIKNNEMIPADVVLLGSTEVNNTCYIETSNLDGETNLKMRQGNPDVADFFVNFKANDRIRSKHSAFSRKTSNFSKGFGGLKKICYKKFF